MATSGDFEMAIHSRRREPACNLPGLALTRLHLAPNRLETGLKWTSTLSLVSPTVSRDSMFSRARATTAKNGSTYAAGWQVSWVEKLVRVVGGCDEAEGNSGLSALINGCRGRARPTGSSSRLTQAAEGTANLTIDHPAFFRHPWSFENVRGRPRSRPDLGFRSADVR